MFRLRDYGAPFLPGMDREFPCPILDPPQVEFDQASALRARADRMEAGE